MIHRPGSLDEARTLDGEYRAGGTDLQARRRLGLVDGDVVDLRRVGGMKTIDVFDAGASIGAMARISAVATHRQLGDRYPALVETAATLATPQIRAVGTIGGNLLQRTRCPYFRRGDVPCLKGGGWSCSARAGDASHGVVFDRGPCVAPHPSSIGMALLTYDAAVTVDGDESMTVSDLFGDGSDGVRDHQLPERSILTSVLLPAAEAGERAAYRRITGRALAEWPTVEAVARIVTDEGTVSAAAVAVGGVAPVPVRLQMVEEALEGASIDDAEALQTAAARATVGADPLPSTAYKVPLLAACVRDVIERAARGERGTGEVAFGETPLP